MPTKPRPTNVGCVYCGSTNVHWAKTRWGWRLIEKDHLHKCEEFNKDLHKRLTQKR